MRLLVVNTAVNSVANMTYKSGEIISHTQQNRLYWCSYHKNLYESNISKIGLCRMFKFLFQFNECRVTSNPVVALKKW